VLSRSGHLLDRLVKQAAQAVSSVAAVLVIAMMLLTTADVCGRYFFNKPIRGALEITELMLLIVVYCCMAYAVVTKAHVSIDVVTSRLSHPSQAVFGSVTSLASLVFFTLISWQAVVLSSVMRSQGDEVMLLRWPTYPFTLIIAFGSALVCLVILPTLLHHLALVWKSGWQFRRRLFFGIAFFLLICAFAFWTSTLLWKVSPLMVGFIGLIAMIAIMFSGMWLGVVMGFIAILGVACISGIEPALSMIGISTFRSVARYSLAVIPLFVLMGAFAHHAGLARQLFYTAHNWLGRLPGGLAMASVGACAGFAAVSGSMVATVATMGTVAIPEMRKYGYDSKLATGAVAAGGTIGILIPPSVALVLYGILAEQPIGILFMAGIIPGILEAVFYMITIFILCKLNPLMGPPSTRRISFTEKVTSLKGSWPVLGLFVLVMGGMYLGVFTPTEAAGVGAFGAFVLIVVKGRLNRKTIFDSLEETVKTTAMVLLFLIGAALLVYFLALSRLPYEVSAIVAGLPVNRYLILVGVILLYIFLGCIMSSVALVVLTVPIFFPLIVELGYDPIWWGIIMVRVCEMGAITPPVGMGVFVIKGVAPDVPIGTIFRGIIPFFIADVCHVAMLVAVPQVVLFLPSLMR